MLGNINSLRRQVKNVAYNFSDAQVKVREATSNDPWGPSSSLMSEIADMSQNTMAFVEIMQMIWKRLNDHGKNWRHVYKSLVLLDYLIKVGSERVAQQCRENIYAIQTLRDFQHIEENKDQGINVREKAKQLVNLLKDDERLKNERARALMARKRFVQNGMGMGSDGTSHSFGRSEHRYSDDEYESGGHGDGYSARSRRRSELEECRPSSMGEEELQLQIAMALSKEEAQKEDEQRKHDELRLAMALNESSQRRAPDDGASFDGGSPAHQASPLSMPGAAAAAGSSQQNKRSAIDDLLSLQPSYAAAASSSDPFGATTTSPRDVMPQVDPWGMPLGSTAGNNSNNGQPDPWSTADIGGPSQHHHQQGADPWTMVDTLRATLPDEGGATGGGGDPMMMMMMDTSQQQQQQRKNTKTPEQFLGQNSSLVNLDNLMGPAAKPSILGMPPPKASVNNPFVAGGGSGSGSGPSPNPFAAGQQQQHRPSPTLHEMRQTPAGGQPASASASAATTTNPFL